MKFEIIDYSVIIKKKKYDPALVEKVCKTVCDFYNVSIEDIRSKTRVIFVMKPKHILLYFLRQTNMSCVQIAEYLRLDNHATIVHGSIKVSKLLNKSPETQKEIKKIVRLLNKK